MRLLLDTNILLKLCHPKRYPEVKAWLRQWLDHATADDTVEVTISAAAEYELRRGYLWKLDRHPHEGVALARLDRFCELLKVQPVSNDSLRTAAGRWAEARRAGYSTAAERDMDWDVIIASQATALDSVVVTENTGHLTRHGVAAKTWSDLPAPSA